MFAGTRQLVIPDLTIMNLRLTLLTVPRTTLPLREFVNFTLVPTVNVHLTLLANCPRANLIASVIEVRSSLVNEPERIERLISCKVILIPCFDCVRFYYSIKTI